MAEKCGCVIERFNGGIAMASYDRIVYCPLHEAAPELLELVKLVAHPKFITDEKGRVSYYVTKSDVAAARQVIKKAESKTNG